MNYETEVAFVATTGPREHETIVGHACYFLNPSNNLAETAFMVEPSWQGAGLGSIMQKRLMEHARALGICGFVAEVLPDNRKMIGLARNCCENVTTERDEDTLHVTMLF